MHMCYTKIDNEKNNVEKIHVTWETEVVCRPWRTFISLTTHWNQMLLYPHQEGIVTGLTRTGM